MAYGDAFDVPKVFMHCTAYRFTRGRRADTAKTEANVIACQSRRKSVSDEFGVLRERSIRLDQTVPNGKGSFWTSRSPVSKDNTQTR